LAVFFLWLLNIRWRMSSTLLHESPSICLRKLCSLRNFTQRPLLSSKIWVSFREVKLRRLKTNRRTMFFNKKCNISVMLMKFTSEDGVKRVKETFIKCPLRESQESVQKKSVLTREEQMHF
jgi:hypothetical protein